MFFLVFFWYLLKAASRIGLNCEDEAGVWAGEDMVVVSGGCPLASVRGELRGGGKAPHAQDEKIHTASPNYR